MLFFVSIVLCCPGKVSPFLPDESIYPPKARTSPPNTYILPPCMNVSRQCLSGCLHGSVARYICVCVACCWQL
ncbi:hypothetical protein V8F20_010474 [Naviculisporaceae sp. PSN 640]